MTEAEKELIETVLVRLHPTGYWQRGDDTPIRDAAAKVREERKPKPEWTVERHPHGVPMIRSRTEVNASLMVNGLGYHGSMELAERIAAILNRAEGQP